MNRRQHTLLSFIFSIHQLCSYAQLKPVYHFQVDDSLQKKEYYAQGSEQQKKLIGSLSKEYREDFKYIYEGRFELVSELFKGTKTVTDRKAHQYLQQVLKDITDVNPELKALTIRLLFSRDSWPNAYSIGEGTLVVNAGLFVYLENEAQLVYIICHELAHLCLDHSNKRIKQNVETLNSEVFKKEIKRISKQEYNAGRQLDSLVKNISYGFLRHNRESEEEADRYAFRFMKKTNYDCKAIISCLQLLDKADDSSFYKPLALEQVFNFNEYPFKKRWVQKESVLFGQMVNDDSPLSAKEKDSLKTHPDCDKRIDLLRDSVQGIKPGKLFITDESYFNQLKKDFLVEITEQLFKKTALSRNLYLSLQMLQQKENLQFAVLSVARCLNKLYEAQKNHWLGTVTTKESRDYPQDFNLLLRMIDRLKLDEIADLNFNFCRYYQVLMEGYRGFDEEFKKARELVSQ